MGLLKMLDKDEYIEYEDINGDYDTDNESTNNTHRKTDQTKTIHLSSFNDERPASSTNQNYKKRFLPIGCSGGNGHNTAITAFIHYFSEFCSTVYTPADYAEKPHSITSVSIFAATQLNSLVTYSHHQAAMLLWWGLLATYVKNDSLRLSLRHWH